MSTQRKARLDKIFSKLNNNNKSAARIKTESKNEFSSTIYEVNKCDGSLTLIREETAPSHLNAVVNKDQANSSQCLPREIEGCTSPLIPEDVWNQDFYVEYNNLVSLPSPGLNSYATTQVKFQADDQAPSPDLNSCAATQVTFQAEVHVPFNEESINYAAENTSNISRRKSNDVVVKSVSFVNPKYINLHKNKCITVSIENLDTIEVLTDQKTTSDERKNKKKLQDITQVLPERDFESSLLISPNTSPFADLFNQIETSPDRLLDEESNKRLSPSIFTEFLTYYDLDAETVQNDNPQLSRKRNTTEVELSDKTIAEAIEDDEPTRKRSKKNNKSTWKKTKVMELRENGKAYKGKKKDGDTWVYDKEKDERSLKPRCHCKISVQKPKFKCLDITDEQRNKIFSKFWRNMSWKEKKVYVKTLTVVKPIQRKRSEKETSKRRNAFELYLEVDSIKYRVCRTMFLNTLDIGEWSLHNWTKLNDESNKRENSQDQDKETRQQREEAKKTQQVTTFFDLLPKLESHYCRSQTTKLYLEPIWESKAQLLKVYNNEFAKERGYDPVSITTLSNVFESMNLALFRPKKDLCDICEAFKCKNVSEENYNKHIEMKKAARCEKINDKESGKEVLTMDLQCVLLCPKSNASALYYKTKLIVHNFTVYDIKRLEGYCFIWNETEGSVTANEFASIITKFLDLFKEKRNLKEGSEITLYSDGCTYQNRNATLSNALLNFAVYNKMTIVQKILEKGHTQMEVDSMHSVIEKKIRNKKINIPADYVNIAKTACSKNPYHVQYLDHTFFKNFDNMKTYKSIRPGKKTGDPVVTDLRQLKYLPEGQILYRLGFTDKHDEKPLPVRVKLNDPISVQDLPPLYNERLKIKKTKFEHLQQLKEVMEVDYQAFYDAIPYE